MKTIALVSCMKTHKQSGIPEKASPLRCQKVLGWGEAGHLQAESRETSLNPALLFTSFVIFCKLSNLWDSEEIKNCNVYLFRLLWELNERMSGTCHFWRRIALWYKAGKPLKTKKVISNHKIGIWFWFNSTIAESIFKLKTHTNGRNHIVI